MRALGLILVTTALGLTTGCTPTYRLEDESVRAGSECEGPLVVAAVVVEPEAHVAPQPSPVVPERIAYTDGAIHSPVTPALVEWWRTIAARGPQLRSDLLIKVGDSNTVHPGFLSCFASGRVNLGPYPLAATVQRFRPGGSFERVSLAAGIGWRAVAEVTGDPTPLEAELTMMPARFAVVMLGTNDVGMGDLDDFVRRLGETLDWLTARGVIPVVSTIPPREDTEAHAVMVPRFNRAIREVVEIRRLPLVDLHLALRDVPAHGLGADRIHLSLPPRGQGWTCDLSPTGTAFGHDVRNAVTLTAVQRLVDALDR